VRGERRAGAARARERLCTRVAAWALSRRGSTGRLGQARVVVMILLVFAAVSATADDAPRWSEHFKVFAAVRNETEDSIIAEADAALSPLGFHRDSIGTTDPAGLIPGIFASYRGKDSASAMIVQASSPECLAFSASNYDRVDSGLVDRAGAAIKGHFRAAFGANVRFYSDAKCSLAL
jgi:hypothetical protein